MLVHMSFILPHPPTVDLDKYNLHRQHHDTLKETSKKGKMGKKQKK